MRFWASFLFRFDSQPVPFGHLISSMHREDDDSYNDTHNDIIRYRTTMTQTSMVNLSLGEMMAI